MIDRSSTDYEALASEIATWLESHRTAAGAERFVLGLSGGIDSAVVCGLCARAAGAERVTGIIMPSHSNPDDARAAAEVAATFRVATITVDLSTATDTLISAIEAGASGVAEGAPERRQQLALANVRPRLRMTTLYYVANLLNGIVTGTGNRSEASIGYFTKYGDGGVDLLPIVDLYKFEVRGVAQTLGVPESIITKPPSAGLWPGQTDEAEIGLSYDELDAALIALTAGDTASIAPAVRDRVAALMATSAHKRVPIPAFIRSGQ